MGPRKIPFSLGHLSTAGKWMMVAVTTMAAVIGLLVNARNLGLTPWLNFGMISYADLAARRVLVSPASDSLHAIGDTLHLAATVTDVRGVTLAGATIVWTSDDTVVATVDSSGDVVARGAGTATIGATVREHFGTARVAVWQRVRAVAIAHDTLLRLPEGGSAQLVARALDGRGHPVHARAIKWASADSGIVAVSETGTANAKGTGHTLLTASADGYASTLSADVVLVPAVAKLIAGSDQRAPAGRRLPQPIQLQVLSRGGRPVSGVPVNFASEGGEGTLEPAAGATDQSGRAHTSWTLGPHAGRQRLLVTVTGVDSTLSVLAEADPIASRTRVELAGQPSSGPAGAALPEPVGIRVTDLAGAAASGVPVAWTALDGGSIEAQGARTDSVGEAWARWTLGSRAGKQHARAQAGNPRTMSVFTVTATAVAGAASKITVVSGGGQEGRVSAALKRPVVVRLTDRNGNAAAGAVVNVKALAGSVADSAPIADAEGVALMRWTLGSYAGAQLLELSVSDNPPLRVSARALPLEPANLALSALPSSAAAGRALAKPITATVTDAYGNLVANAQVAFSVSAGTASPARVMTDAKGLAISHWTLGASAGDQTITAAVRGTTVKARAVVTATKSAQH